MENPQSQSGSTEWLTRFTLEALTKLLAQMGAVQATLERNAAHSNQRHDDLKHEIFPRFERVEARMEAIDQRTRGQPDIASSWARRLFGGVGVFLFEHLPWKHVLLMVPAFLLGVAGHLMPDQAAAWVVWFKGWLVASESR